MGCGASSLKSSNEHRDDLNPKPHTQNEVRQTSGFTRSNSAGAVPTADDYGADTSDRKDGAVETEDLKKPAKEKTRKELIAEAKARRAGRGTETRQADIAGIAWS